MPGLLASAVIFRALAAYLVLSGDPLQDGLHIVAKVFADPNAGNRIGSFPSFWRVEEAFPDLQF